MSKHVKETIYLPQYKQAVKKLRKQHKVRTLIKLEKIIEQLENFEITTQYHNHDLHGNMSDYSDIHINQDVVLLYKYEDNKLYTNLILGNIVSHDELNRNKRRFENQQIDNLLVLEEKEPTKLLNAKELKYSKKQIKRINKRAGIPPNPAEYNVHDSLYSPQSYANYGHTGTGGVEAQSPTPPGAVTSSGASVGECLHKKVKLILDEE